jgi:hypothetical protein
MYGDGNDLLPFELSRNPNTEWLANAGFGLLSIYLSVIFMFHLIFLSFLDTPQKTWTVTHTVHALVTMVYLHWIKGSPNFEQGEMNAMTLWEQLDATHGAVSNAKRALIGVPTVLCYVSCHVCQWQASWQVAWNLIVWSVVMLAKMPFMNGVRVLGINRTTGIDDDRRKAL